LQPRSAAEAAAAAAAVVMKAHRPTRPLGAINLISFFGPFVGEWANSLTLRPSILCSNMHNATGGVRGAES